MIILSLWFIGYLIMIGLAFWYKPLDANILDIIVMLIILFICWPFILGYFIRESLQ